MSKKIKIILNGPYQVEGQVPLKQANIILDEDGMSKSWQQGKTYPTQQDEYSLCRCGHSKDKPFCDGAHQTSGFIGKELASYERDEGGMAFYEGEQLELLDDEELCASMRFCDRGIQIWDAVMDSDNPENKKLAMEEASCCASGRLLLSKKDGIIMEPSFLQEISPINDTAAICRGPLWVKGGIELIGANGKSYQIRNRMTLCRCGESNNLPFCDTTHLSCPHMQGKDE